MLHLNCCVSREIDRKGHQDRHHRVKKKKMPADVQYFEDFQEFFDDKLLAISLWQARSMVNSPKVKGKKLILEIYPGNEKLPMMVTHKRGHS